MSVDPPPSVDPRLTVHTNLWLEIDKQVVLSRRRVQLLEAINEAGSIRAAAARMKITYDLAWHRIDRMERALGVRLVERQRGGPQGGSAHLTPEAQHYLARFNRFAAEVDTVIARLFEQTFIEGS